MSVLNGKPAGPSVLERLKQGGGASALAKAATGDAANANALELGKPVPETLKGAQGNIDHKLRMLQNANNASRGVTKLRRDVIAVPAKLSEAHVLFQHPLKPNFGTADKGGKIIRFKDGFYQTADKEQIEFLKANAQHFGLFEYKEKPKEAEKKPK